jgi:hypothetical protein
MIFACKILEENDEKWTLFYPSLAGIIDNSASTIL